MVALIDHLETVVGDMRESDHAPAPTIAPPVILAETSPVSEIFEETDIRQAIQAMAVQANASVVLDEQLSGTTSAVIENESFESALRKVLLPVGGVFCKQKGRIQYTPTDPSIG